MTRNIARLELVGLGKRYGGVPALEDVTIAAGEGEIVGITGPSAAGKTTMCRLVSGIEAPSSGDIVLGGETVTGLPPQRRNVAYMFESYALYPHLSVIDNIAAPLRSPRNKPRMDAAAIETRVKEVLALTEMEDLAFRRPAELSGGQKQRVALCRTLVQDPAVFLFDEPIAHLDAKLRHMLRGEIRRRQTKRRAPTLWCTPDAMEALSVAGRVVVLIDGHVHQVGTPEEIYLEPADVSVARLIGDPAMNLMTGIVKEEAGRLMFRNEGAALALPDALRPALRKTPSNTEFVVGVRPSEIDLSRQPANGPENLGPENMGPENMGEVYAFEPFGKYSIVSIQLGGDILKLKTSNPTTFKNGDRVGIEFKEVQYVLFDAETGRRLNYSTV